MDESYLESDGLKNYKAKVELCIRHHQNDAVFADYLNDVYLDADQIYFLIKLKTPK